MINQILDLVKQYGQQSVVQNADVPDEYNNVVMSETASTITGGLQNMLAGGGLQSVISMFTGNNGQSRNNILSNPIVAMMVGHLASKLMGKLKLSPAVANSVATNIIPGVIGSIVNRTRSNAAKDNNFDLNDLIGAFTGGNGAQSSGINFQDILNQLGSNGNNAQGADFTNITQTVTQNAQQQAQQKDSVTDLINSFFK